MRIRNARSWHNDCTGLRWLRSLGDRGWWWPTSMPIRTSMSSQDTFALLRRQDGRGRSRTGSTQGYAYVATSVAGNAAACACPAAGRIRACYSHHGPRALRPQQSMPMPMLRTVLKLMMSTTVKSMMKMMKSMKIMDVGRRAKSKQRQRLAYPTVLLLFALCAPPQARRSTTAARTATGSDLGSRPLLIEVTLRARSCDADIPQAPLQGSMLNLQGYVP